MTRSSTEPPPVHNRPCAPRGVYDSSMEHIALQVAALARNIEIIGADAFTRGGFTQVPNAVLTMTSISVGAKLAYTMLLKYAWAEGACYPGQLKLAQDMGSGERSVRRYLDELEAAGLLEVDRRGLGKTNYYRLHETVRSKPTRKRNPVRV